MIIYIDIISGDEVGSDSFPAEVIDDVLIRMTTKVIVKTEDGYNMGAGEFGGGEEAAYDATSTSVNNCVDAHRLTSTNFDKKGYMTYIKGYMAKIKKQLEESNPERVPVFTRNATIAVKKILENFKDYDFFVGEGMNFEGMIILKNYAEDGVTPYLYVWKDGIRQQKV
eukprot:TRINITY_DN85_c0_g1_i1.p1 TRINITY_DN85_c0_g1~~TRINITY_DN85_c0_g1_i1.p1  ORF type:complete len:168 (-),score=37.08 TRINITY_DN85_c0_g1_i1:93-596(-)